MYYHAFVNVKKIEINQQINLTTVNTVP